MLKLITPVGFLFLFLLILAPIGLSIYGLYLAFSASIVLGILVLLIEPSPFILGLVAFFGNPDVAEKLASWLGLA